MSLTLRRDLYPASTPFADALRQLQRDGDASEAARIHELTRIADRALVHRLSMEAGGRSAPALLTLLPAVQVAWADGACDDHERQLLRAVAWSLDVDLDPRGWDVLERWLRERPPIAHGVLWLDFVNALLLSLPAVDYEACRRLALDAAWAVARASGGGWLASPVSREEHDVLEALDTALSPASHLPVFDLAS